MVDDRERAQGIRQGGGGTQQGERAQRAPGRIDQDDDPLDKPRDRGMNRDQDDEKDDQE